MKRSTQEKKRKEKRNKIIRVRTNTSQGPQSQVETEFDVPELKVLYQRNAKRTKRHHKLEKSVYQLVFSSYLKTYWSLRHYRDLSERSQYPSEIKRINT